MSGNGKGLGDIQWKDIDALETYFDILRQGVSLPRRKWIVAPDRQPPVIPGMEAMQRFFEEHALPRMWNLLADLWTKFQCGTYFTKGPNWLEPPLTAIPFEVRNEDAVAVGATDTRIASATVPDRFVGAMLRFGHELTDPTQWGTVIWSIRVAEQPIPSYHQFKRQLGSTIAPTPLASHIPAKHGSVVEVVARTAGAAVSAFVRLQGFIFAPRSITQDGSFRDYHTL